MTSTLTMTSGRNSLQRRLTNLAGCNRSISIGNSGSPLLNASDNGKNVSMFIFIFFFACLHVFIMTMLLLFLFSALLLVKNYYVVKMFLKSFLFQQFKHLYIFCVIFFKVKINEYVY